MDRILPLIVTVLFGIVTFIFLVLGLLNRIGAISAHEDALRMNAAPDCVLQSPDSNCISYRSAIVADSSVAGTLELDFGNGEIVQVDVAHRTHLATGVASDRNARVKVWSGKFVEVTYDSEIIETDTNPKNYVQTWPVLLAFGALGVVITAAAYVIVSSATGYTPEFLRWRRSAKRPVP